MDEREALKKLKRQNQQALCWFIDRYGGYVHTVIGSIIGSELLADAGEELSSDVFLVLWQRAHTLRSDNVKAFLASVARNKAKAYLSSLGRTLSLDEDDLELVARDNVEQETERRELADLLNRALLAMPHPQREIFYRYYYYNQPIGDIARALDMNPATVKTKLHRGRALLKEKLTQGGFLDEV